MAALNMHVYLIYAPTGDPEILTKLFEDAHVVRDGLMLIESAEHQSELYHEVKFNLPKDAPLFVARLDHQPKFKGVEKGLLSWVRERYDGMTA
jgi:hypothetical protein